MMSVAWKRWALGAFVLAVVVALGVHTTFAQGGAGGGRAASAYTYPVPSEADLRLLVGAIDIHVHLDPDSQQGRANDVIDMAKKAKARGMRGFVIKQHYDQTAQMAYLVRKEVPGIEVFGMVGQNWTTGGVNPSAVEHFAQVKGGWGRLVMMPTWDGEHNVKIGASGCSNLQGGGYKDTRAFAADKASGVVSVAKNGELLPAVKDVISIIAKAKTRDSSGELVLATGHLSPEEGLMVLREGQAQGVKHMVAWHPFGCPIMATIPQMQEAVKLGAFVEFPAGYGMGPTSASAPSSGRSWGGIPISVYADAIRKVGPDHVIISTDLGAHPSPPDGLAAFGGMLRKAGFTEQELARMMKENPAQLLGLPIQASPQTQANR